MTFYSWVNCRCYVDGRTAPLPVPAEAFCFAPDRSPGTCPGWDDDETTQLVRAWLQTCCLHPGLIAVSHDFGTAIGDVFDAFQHVDPDRTRYPAMLNPSDDQLTHPDAAARCLDEIADFRRTANLGTATFLIDEELDKPITWRILGQVEVSLGRDSLGVEIGFDSEGVFARRPAQPADSIFRRWLRWSKAGVVEVWRSRHFDQRFLEPDRIERTRERLVEYADLDSDGRFRCRLPIESWIDERTADGQGDVRFRLPPRLRVEERPAYASVVGWMLDWLEELFRASVETGHPVIWSY
jgi:hypothetical protein